MPPPSRSPILSLAEWVTLAVVDEGPAHGFAVASLTAPDGALGRVWHLPRPVVYRALPRLAEARLVRMGEATAGRGPARHPYSITPAGRRAVATWLGTPVGHVREVRSELLVKLALLDRRGASAAGLVARQREAFGDIASALLVEAPTSGFDETIRRWRRANVLATLDFLADLDADTST